MKTVLLCLMLAGCATVPDVKALCEAGGGCMTLRQVVQATQKAWNDGWAKGYHKGEDSTVPACMRTL